MNAYQLHVLLGISVMHNMQNYISQDCLQKMQAAHSTAQTDRVLLLMGTALERLNGVARLHQIKGLQNAK